MKTSEYLISTGWCDGCDVYEAPGDSSRLKQYVADKWKASTALNDYADTFLPKRSFDFGPLILLSAEDIEEQNATWDDGALLSNFGLLPIGSSAGDDCLFMVVDTGQILFLDLSQVPVEDMRENHLGSTAIEDFDVEQWIAECGEEADEDDGELYGVFASFAEFDESLMAWHQECEDDDDEG
jgi:hypothetical protein